MADDDDGDPGSRHLTPDELAVIADELRQMGYTVTSPSTAKTRGHTRLAPAWLRETDGGFEIRDRD